MLLSTVEAYLPAFAHVYGLLPWDVDRLTVGQWRGFKGYLDDLREGSGG